MGVIGKNIKIFCANSNVELTGMIANRLGLPVGKSEVSTFSDGEISVNIKESVRGCDVFVVQSTCKPVNRNLMELLIMIDAFKRASAARITAVIPYFGYARQDRKVKPRDPISAKLVANLITAAGTDRVLTMDLHAPQIQGFFDIPVDNLMGAPLLAAYFTEKFRNNTDNLIVISPDIGSVDRARKFAGRINAPLAIIDKRRPQANVSEVMNIIGDVRGKTALLVDDLIDTGGTLCNAARSLVEAGGALEVYACATHGVLSGPALERISSSRIKEIIILDTIPQDKISPKISTVTVSSIFAEAINKIHREEAISPLFV